MLYLNSREALQSVSFEYFLTLCLISSFSATNCVMGGMEIEIRDEGTQYETFILMLS